MRVHLRHLPALLSLVSLLFVGVGLTAPAQTGADSLAVSVRDASGGGFETVKVTVSSRDSDSQKTVAPRTAASRADNEFVLDRVPPGRYLIKVEYKCRNGREIEDEITVTVDERASSRDIKMKPATCGDVLKPKGRTGIFGAIGRGVTKSVGVIVGGMARIIPDGDEKPVPGGDRPRPTPTPTPRRGD